MTCNSQSNDLGMGGKLDDRFKDFHTEGQKVKGLGERINPVSVCHVKIGRILRCNP